MEKCHEITGASVPSGLSGIFSREIRHTDIIDIEEMKSYIIEKANN